MGSVTKWIVLVLVICVFTRNSLGKSGNKDHISRDSANKNCRVAMENFQRKLTQSENDLKKGGKVAMAAGLKRKLLLVMKKMAEQNCKGINECSTKTHDCDKNAVCKDTDVAFSCTCKPGYKGDGLKCIAMDECVKAGDVCPSALHCLKQRDASYACACDAEGFKVVGKGEARTCAAMDECVKAGDVCPSALHCLKQRDGSYACGCDAEGFKVVGERDARNCADIDECKEKKFTCPMDRVCKNRPGGYECLCKKGQRLDYDGKCVPLTKCDKKGLSCPQYSECKKLPSGSYDCACLKGFEEVKEEGKLKRCEAIVKGACNCDEKTEECRRGKCRCKSALGFRRNNMGRCVRRSADCNCGAHGECLTGNECTCHVGYFDDGGVCRDVDECRTTCMKDTQQCINSQGSYNCKCKVGYEKKNGVADDECTKVCKCGKHEKCDKNGNCKCKKGYIKKQGKCARVKALSKVKGDAYSTKSSGHVTLLTSVLLGGLALAA